MVKDINKSNLLIFGENFKEFRIKSDLSYRKLSQLCDVDYSDISKIEKGQVNITLLTIIELAKGLGVHPKQLLEGNFE